LKFSIKLIIFCRDIALSKKQGTKSKGAFENYFPRLKVPRDPPQSPLRRGKNLNSPPFLRGAGGDLSGFL
jgi:hypothetical protein